MVRKATKKRITVAKRFGRLHVFAIVVATLVLGISTVTVLSRQTAKGKEPNQPEKISAAPKANKTTVIVRTAGQDVTVQTSDEIQPLTPQEAEKMAAGLKPMLNQSTEGLVQVQHPDGSVSVDLEGRFQDVTVARVNKDGTVSQSCVNNPKAAGAFFGIDPKLIENAPNVRTKTNQN